MWSSPLFWIAFAIALFWALGAYNRLMRLRSAVAQAFGSFDAHMVRLVALMGELHATQTVQGAALPGDAVAPPERGSHEIAALHGATTQLSASLAVARARPLQPDAIAALAAAWSVLRASWQSAEASLQTPALPKEELDAETSVPPEGAAATPLPALSASPATPWPERWSEHAQHIEHAIRVFNEAVAHYNAAADQFPASVLAWVFGFKAARTL